MATCTVKSSYGYSLIVSFNWTTVQTALIKPGFLFQQGGNAITDHKLTRSLKSDFQPQFLMSVTRNKVKNR